MRQRQRDDMVLLAHIREQHRLSLQSYSRPRMTRRAGTGTEDWAPEHRSFDA